LFVFVDETAPETSELGSTHTKPNQSAEVHDVDEEAVADPVRLGVEEADGFGVADSLGVVVGSLQPYQPGVLHVLDLAEDEIELDEVDEVVVVVDARICVSVVMVIVDVIVVEPSLHPNQPGVRQVVTVVVLI